MGYLAAFPVLGLSLLLQLAVFSRMPLLHGTADLVLLVLVCWALQDRVKSHWFWTLLAGGMVTLASGLPFYTPVFGYLAAVGLTRLLHRQVWQSPILAMFIATFVSTLVYHGMSLAALEIAGRGLPLAEALTMVTLPSALWNLMLAFPVYIVISDLANWIHPSDIA